MMYSAKSQEKTRIVFVGLGNHGFTLLAFFVSVIARHSISLVIDPSPKSQKLAIKVLRCPHYIDIERPERKSYYWFGRICLRLCAGRLLLEARTVPYKLI